MYDLAFCLPYDSKIFWDGRNTTLNEHWLTITIINEDFYNKDFEVCSQNYFEYIDNLQYDNSYVKNCKIVREPQIIQTYHIEDTMLCSIKTLWLKIFQRKYKNYYNKKMKYYKNPKNIMNRSIHGKWV